MPLDPQLLFFGVLILVIVLFMFRNGRKRQRDQLALTQGIKPGAEVMTTFGVFGTVESFDEAENKITLRTGPTSELTIHRQAVGRVVTPVEGDTAEGAEAPVLLDDAAADPVFGERVEPRADSDAPETRTTENPAVRRTGGGGSGSAAE